MHKFKLGQQVKVVSTTGLSTRTANTNYVRLGSTFIIVRVSACGTKYRQDVEQTWCDEQDLQLVLRTVYTRKPR